MFFRPDRTTPKAEAPPTVFKVGDYVIPPFREGVDSATMVLYVGDKVARFTRDAPEGVVHVATGPDTIVSKVMRPDGTVTDLTDADTAGSAEAVIGSPRYLAFQQDLSLREEVLDTSKYPPPYAEIQYPLDR